MLVTHQELKLHVLGAVVPDNANIKHFHHHRGFPGGSVIKNPPANTRDLGSIPGSGSAPGERNASPL